MESLTKTSPITRIIEEANHQYLKEVEGKTYTVIPKNPSNPSYLESLAKRITGAVSQVFERIAEFFYRVKRPSYLYLKQFEIQNL